MDTYTRTLTRSCLGRLLLTSAVAVVVLLGFGCIAVFAAAIPAGDDVQLVIVGIGLAVLVIGLVGGSIAWAVWVYRKRAAVMDEAFGPLGLRGERYSLAGRRYSGSYRGRETNVYFHISGGNYNRVPVLQVYVSGRIPTRVSIGTRNILGTLVGDLIKREPMQVADPAFADLQVYPHDEGWARGFLDDLAVRSSILDLFDAKIGALKALLVGPGSVNLTLRYFNPEDLTAENLRGFLERLLPLAEAAERLPAPADPLDESDLARLSRSDRGSLAWVAGGVIAVVILCPLVIAAVVAGLLLFLNP